jgi:hypothetical protein
MRSFLAAVGVAFVLGAIVSPTDLLATATIIRRRFDDAAALVACRVVVAAVVVGAPRSDPRSSRSRCCGRLPWRLASA